MDHLLIPQNPVHSRIEVPFLSVRTYDAPFQTFSERSGWTKDKISNKNLTDSEIEDLKSLLQTWLFFGLVQETFGSLTKPSHWICKGRSGNDVISTSYLRSLLKQFSANQERSSIESRDASHREHIDQCLKIAIDTVNGLSLRNSPIIESDEVLSIAILCDVIEKSLGTDRDAYRASGSLHLMVSRPLQSKMLKDGWCKNDVYRLSHQLDLPSLYLASNLDRPEAQVCHKSCENSLCVKSQVNESKYVTQHDRKVCDGNCGFVGVSQDELAHILRSGYIPLISYDPENAPDNITLVPRAPGTSYIAISHIWSHGLGNPHENSLPRCQLRRISRLVKGTLRDTESSIVLFWIDTVCFPVHHKEAADLALIFMRRTYEEATQVLVLDRYLEGVDSKPLLRTECLLRILCSSWTRRLWTLQEGVLAKILLFQFADEAIEIGNATFLMTAEMTFVTSDRSLEYHPIFSMVSELWEAWKTAKSDPPRILLNYLSGGLRWRRTSVESDEALCLATLAGLDMEELTKVDSASRMSKFWSLLPRISDQAVFWSGSKLDKVGFRWAPSTFLGQPNAIFQDLANTSFSEASGSNVVSLTKSGINFSCAGIMLNSFRANIGRRIWIRDQSGRWYLLQRHGSAVIQPRPDDESEMSRTLVFIMKQSLKQSFSGPSPERSVTCVVASIYDVDEEKDIVYANTEDVGFLIPQGDLASATLVEPRLATRVLESERLLGLDQQGSGSIEHEREISTKQDAPEELPLPLLSVAQERPTSTSEKVSLLRESPVSAQKVRVLNEDLAIERLRARDEDGRLSIDILGEHYMFDGIELAEDQNWCLD